MFGKFILDQDLSPSLRMEELDAAAAGGRTVVMPRYESYIDPVLYGIYLKCSPLVVITPQLERMPWFASFSDLFRHVTVDMNDPSAEAKIKEAIASSDVTVVFPEIEPTTDGVPGKVSEAAVAALMGARIVPAVATGTIFSKYSRTGDRFTAAASQKVRMLAHPVRTIKSDSIGAARLEVERMLGDVTADGLWERKPLFDSLVEQRDRWGWNKTIGIEPDGSRVSWRDLVERAVLLSRLCSEFTDPGECFGIMLPNTTMTLASIMAASRARRVPAMINYSMGLRGTISACGTARVRTIVTSRRFVEQGKLDGLVRGLDGAGIETRYLEDILAGASRETMLSCAVEAMGAKPLPPDEAARVADETAVVLFTSGSEGTPKAVALSHNNIQSNVAQLRAAIPLWRTDVAIAVLPMFHSYGLTTSVFLSLAAGMEIAFYPTPLHFKKIPQYIHEVRGSILFGTNSFLSGWGRAADSADFSELRIVVCGGDKLRDSTYSLWHERFGIRIQEGYGVTECAPVLGVNKFGRYKRGSIGPALPLVSTALTPVEGVAEGGRLIVKGPNIMRGYMQKDGTITPPPDTGYDTGDICTIDEEGYITIVGRAKRFAKIGGEMVSLAQVEEAVSEVWPDDAHAVVSVPDERRGEMIVLLTERADPDRAALADALVKKGVPELALPKRAAHIDALPRIGVGKVDYQTAAKMAVEMEMNM